jgi:hypothetical protein
MTGFRSNWPSLPIRCVRRKARLSSTERNMDCLICLPMAPVARHGRLR